MSSFNDGVMIVLSSPSGAGKTTLVKKLSILIKNEFLRKTMGKSGRELVEKKFTLKRMILSIEKKYLDLYKTKN